ncbi:hypothetical protein BV22DRAFT_1039506 [Leucogyrophana mollusca]|uniref:Uncharacterized protein n=1 Tax=Leucogyrophana mollusca TaxID=85980 RepID=A0ACB8B4P6_9AGAM|nr:hypothetical protein BV22DRAFT_1039506 [Leucogyrophana mollusca]
MSLLSDLLVAFVLASLSASLSQTIWPCGRVSSFGLAHFFFPSVFGVPAVFYTLPGAVRALAVSRGSLPPIDL